MTTRRWILFLLPAAMISLLAGCGGSTANVQNPPPPPQSQVKIAFQPEPGGSLAVSSAENVTAVVTSDPNNYGVDWSLTCQADPDNKSGLCGNLSTFHTASGAATTYTAPSTLSASSMAVEIVAFATADRNQNVVAPIIVSTFDSGLKGNYVLQAQGVATNGGPYYQFAGVIVLDGNGGISSGEQTINFVGPSGLVSQSDQIQKSGSSYFLGNDGRGTITINTGDNDIGTNGIETFAFVFLSDSQALISQMDLGTAATGTSATGTMDLQTSTAAPSGGYAFAVSGLDIATMAPLSFGGILNIDSPNKISGNGSVADEIVIRKVTASAGLFGTLSNPDALGGITFNLTAGFGFNNFPKQIQFTGYIVDDTHIKLIESDNTASGAGFGSTAGLAIGQGSATGTFKDNSSFSGRYVFGVPGVDLSHGNLLPSTSTSVGLFTADGSGNLSNGFMDTFLLLSTTQPPFTPGAQISAAFGGTYSVDSSGTGRASLVLNNFNPVPFNGYQPIIFFYLTGNGNPPLVLAGGDVHYPTLGTGIAYPQSSNPFTFSGDYGLSFTQVNSIGENDGTAQMNANPAATPPSLAGFADLNLGFGANLDQPFTGGFSTPASNGLFPGTLVGNNTIGSSAVFTPQIAVDYYIIDPGHGFWVETDLVNSVPPATPPTPSGQVSFGYYVARTPVCTGCP